MFLINYHQIWASFKSDQFLSDQALLSSCGHPFLSASGLLLPLQKACAVWKKKSRLGSMLMLFFHFIGFFFKSKWKLLLRRIDCYYLQNGEVPLWPQGVNATKKIAFMSKTNNEGQNPHLKLRFPIRLVISFFFLSHLYFDVKEKTKTLVQRISCLQFPSSLSTFIITTSR